MVYSKIIKKLVGLVLLVAFAQQVLGAARSAAAAAAAYYETSRAVDVSGASSSSDGKRLAAMAEQAGRESKEVVVQDSRADVMAKRGNIWATSATLPYALLSMKPKHLDAIAALLTCSLNQGFDMQQLPKTVQNIIFNYTTPGYDWFMNPQWLRTDVCISSAEIAHDNILFSADGSVLWIKVDSSSDHETCYYRLNLGTKRLKGSLVFCPPIDVLHTFNAQDKRIHPATGEKLVMRGKYVDIEKEGKIVKRLSLGKLDKKSYICKAYYCANNKEIAVMVHDKNDNHTLYFYDAKTWRFTDALKDDAIRTIHESDDGRYFGVAYEDGRVLITDRYAPAQKQEEIMLKQQGLISALAVTPDNSCLAVGYKDGTIALCDIATKLQVRTHTFDHEIGAIRFSSDNTLCCVAMFKENPAQDGSIDTELAVLKKHSTKSWQEGLIWLALNNSKEEDYPALLRSKMVRELTPEQRYTLARHCCLADARVEPEIFAIDWDPGWHLMPVIDPVEEDAEGDVFHDELPDEFVDEDAV